MHEFYCVECGWMTMQGDQWRDLSISPRRPSLV